MPNGLCNWLLWPAWRLLPRWKRSTFPSFLIYRYARPTPQSNQTNPTQLPWQKEQEESQCGKCFVCEDPEGFTSLTTTNPESATSSKSAALLWSSFPPDARNFCAVQISVLHQTRDEPAYGDPGSEHSQVARPWRDQLHFCRPLPCRHWRRRPFRRRPECKGFRVAGPGIAW